MSLRTQADHDWHVSFIFVLNGNDTKQGMRFLKLKRTIYHNSLKFVLFSCGTMSDSDECKIFLPCAFFLSGYVHLASIGSVAACLSQCKTVTKV